MADIIAFNQANPDRCLRFGQDLFLASQATKGDLSELEYKSARAMDLMAAKERGLDAYMSQHKLDAVVFPGVARRGDRGQAGLSQRAGAGRLDLAASATRRRRTIRSASPSPAAPGASTSSCGWPTPTSRRPTCASRRRACLPCKDCHQLPRKVAAIRCTRAGILRHCCHSARTPTPALCANAPTRFHRTIGRDGRKVLQGKGGQHGARQPAPSRARTPNTGNGRRYSAPGSRVIDRAIAHGETSTSAVIHRL